MTTYSRAVIEGVERIYADVDGRPDYRLVDLASRAGATIEPCEAPPRGIVHVVEHTEDGRIIVHGCEGGRPSEAIMSRAHRLETGVSAAAVRARAQVDVWRAEAEAGTLSAEDNTIRAICESAGIDDTDEIRVLRAAQRGAVARHQRLAKRKFRELLAEATESDLTQTQADTILADALGLAGVLALSEKQIRNRLARVTSLISKGGEDD